MTRSLAQVLESSVSRWCVAFALILALVVPAGAATTLDRNLRDCDHAIDLALTGQEARAESIFVSLLSTLPATALNNLANLQLRRGQRDVAIEFYRAASEIDADDAGITLNTATATLLTGDTRGARTLADQAVNQAGGVDAAARLLGPSAGSAAKMKAADPARERERIWQLVQCAGHGFPKDTTAVDTSRVAKKKRERGTEYTQPRPHRGNTNPPFVYWKE